MTFAGLQLEGQSLHQEASKSCVGRIAFIRPFDGRNSTKSRRELVCSALFCSVCSIYSKNLEGHVSMAIPDISYVTRDSMYFNATSLYLNSELLHAPRV